jgi:glycogen debranching enzyme
LIVVDGISYIPSSAVLTGISKFSIKDDRAFALVDGLGEAPRLYTPSSELGFYYNDTRFLNVWEMSINGSTPVPLAQEARFGGSALVISMSNRDLPPLDGKGRIPRDTFLIRRVLALVDDELFETLEIKNFGNELQEIQLEQWVGSRFDDIFEVRGMERAKRGRLLSPTERENGRPTTILQYEGLDGLVRRTFITRLQPSQRLRDQRSADGGIQIGHVTRLRLQPKQALLIKTIVTFDREPDGKIHGEDFGSMTLGEKMRLLLSNRATSLITPVQFESDNAIFDRSIENAQIDISMLLTRESGGLLYPYAGIPWFSAPFGRDGILTAYQMLPWAPDLAHGVLEYAFNTMGTKDDDFTDEQPGKIFHEMRQGEMARTREVPYIPYFGSVDSTPLALILLYEYVRWTNDLETLRRWWPMALRALDWLSLSTSVDEEGFVFYNRRLPTGLVNQGWKDSHDSVMHEDGKLAHAPIRLCEVQAYSFAARMGMAAMAGALGHRELSARLRLGALELRARFMDAFWVSEENFVALALDGNRVPCRVRASNMGHCLWGQILPAEQAAQVASHLVSPQMFSGYGVRTLAADEAAYNPLSYHNGSVWPHDCSIIMEGLRAYGLRTELELVVGGLLAVLEASDDFRLPELFCGFRRRDDAPPVPYEVACKPQAWAAGSLFLMVKAMLGLSMDIDQPYFSLHSPILPPGVTQLEIRGLRARDSEFNLFLKRSSVGTQVEYRRLSGKVKLMTIR